MNPLLGAAGNWVGFAQRCFGCPEGREWTKSQPLIRPNFSLKWLIVGSLVFVASLQACCRSGLSVLQLKWKHHFQFAGYSMHLKRVLPNAGLDVHILERGGPGHRCLPKSFAIGPSGISSLHHSSVLRELDGWLRLVVLGRHLPASPAVSPGCAPV